MFGLIGATLDQGVQPSRWERWRPTVDLFRHEDLLVAEAHLLSSVDAALEATILADIAAVSPETEVRVHRPRIEDAWSFEEVFGALFDLATSIDWALDDDLLVHITTGSHVVQICLFLLTQSRHLPGRLVQTAPPRKRGRQAGPYTIIDLDLSRYDLVAGRLSTAQRDATSHLKQGIETRNPAFNALIDQLERVATGSRAPLLLQGPTGAGKTRLARRIFELKQRRHQLRGRFVEVNCATLRGDAAMSALFGHVRGAFTGAQRDRPGLLRGADGGLLFLDEIAELGGDEQAMLLRALEEKRFLPVGADKEVSSDFQLIAGSHRDLRDAVAAGDFREDLLARIDLWRFDLPGLADRREDIEPNLDHELEAVRARSGRRVVMTPDARRAFLAFATSPEATWPRNFRDFAGVVERLATLAPGGKITPREVDEELERLRGRWARPRRGAKDDDATLDEVLGSAGRAGLDPFEQVQLAEVIRVCRRCRTLSEAGRVLFSVSRRAKRKPNDADRLRKYLARHGLAFDDLR